MPAAQPLIRATTFSNNNNNSNPTHRIRLVPHLDSRRTLRFEPITRDLKDNDTPLRIGRFTDRSGIGLAAVNALNTNKLAFKSKVVSRAHAEIWADSGKFYIKDTKSSSGTFLNHLRLSPAGSESKPHQLKDGDIVQLGVDYQGGTEDIYKSVKIRIEAGREWQAAPNAFKCVFIHVFE
jgi:pSer/pThr/pTyr-binding forkhead associated (FHA) protein